MQELHRRDGPMARFGLRELVAYATLLVLLECGLAFSAASFRLYSEWHRHPTIFRRVREPSMSQVDLLLAAAVAVCIAICQLAAVLRQNPLLSWLTGSVFMSIAFVGILRVLAPTYFLDAFDIRDIDHVDRKGMFSVIEFALIASWLFIGIVMLRHGRRCTDIKDLHQ
jgi:hypothetical protein